MKKIFFPLLVGISFALSSGALEFTNSEDLGDDGYRLEWKHDAESITFRMSAPTTGWVGVGFSAGRTMENSDLIMAGRTTSGAYVFDAHASSNTLPPVDGKQNVEVVSAIEQDGRTIVTVERKLKTMDTNDRDIVEGPMNILWAFGRNDVIGAPARGNYHSRNRGFASLELITKTPEPELPKPVMPDITFTNSAQMRDVMTVSWVVTGGDITFKISTPTPTKFGWCGIGVSPSGTMAGADMIVVGLDENSPYILDLYAERNGIPLVDQKQDAQLVYHSEMNSEANIIVKRSLTATDAEDMSITEGGTHCCWACGRGDMSNGPVRLNYHIGYRGSKFLHLVGTEGNIHLTNSMSLDEAEEVRLRWGFNETYIELELSAPTSGWVGLGFSPGHDMAGADMMIGGLSDEIYVLDLHGERNGVPLVDQSQDVQVYGAKQEGMRTTVVFGRKLEAMDENDISIQNKDMNIIWAYGERDMFDVPRSRMYHGRSSRGVTTTSLLCVPEPTTEPTRPPSLLPLNPDGTVKLGWSVNMTEGMIYMLVIAPTTGWIGIGFSPGGTMAGADMMIGGRRDDGKLYIFDTFAKKNGLPNIDDASQDAEIFEEVEEDGGTRIAIKRLLKTNDPKDIEIKPGKMNVIWAFGERDIGETLERRNYHFKTRGSKEIELLAEPEEEVKFDEESIYEFHRVINKKRNIQLSWGHNGKRIFLEITMPTIGWMGIGFSPVRNMTGADIILTGVRNEKPYVLDCFASKNGAPKIDASQDIELLKFVENGTHTMVRLTRLIKTADTAKDNEIKGDYYLIWACGNGDLKSLPRRFYHQRKRGAVKVSLLRPMTTVIPDDYVYNPLPTVPATLRS